MDVSKYPKFYTIGITDRCNAACIMCFRTSPNEAKKSRNDMPLEYLKKLHQGLLNAEVIRWYADGEFFAVRNLEYYMDYIKQYTARENGFSTNGKLLKKYAAMIAESNINFIDISLDGATPETLESIRIGVKLKDIIEGIFELQKECELRSKPCPKLKFVFCSMRRNIEEIPLVIELAHQVRVSTVYMMPLDTGFHPELEKEKLSYYPGLEREYFQQAKKLAKKYNILFDHTHRKVLNLDDADETTNKDQLMGHKITDSMIACPLPWSDVLVTQEGEIKVCCYNPRIMGSLRDSTLEEIWHGEKFGRLRQSVLNKTFSEGCSDGKCHIAGGNLHYIL